MLFFAAGQFDRVEQHAAQGLSRWQAHLLAIFLCRRLSARRWACAKIRQTMPCLRPPGPRTALRPALRSPGSRTAPALRPPGPRTAPSPIHDTCKKPTRSRKHQAPGTETMCRIRLHVIFRADALRAIICCRLCSCRPAHILL